MEISEQHLIAQTLRAAKSKRILDLGCGSGEHARSFAAQGYDVVAVDASEAAINEARAQLVPSNLEFVLADLGAVERIGRGHFGGAFCLGNTLPYLLSAESISRLFIGLRRRLLPGAPLLVQIFNYERISLAGIHTQTTTQQNTILLEVTEPVDPAESGQEGIMRRTTASLSYRPDRSPSIEHVDTKAFHLRGWTSAELQTSLKVSRFSVLKEYGDLNGSPFDPEKSAEIILVAA